MIFVTSDTHLFHKNICSGISQWEDTKRCRNFDSIDDMNEKIIENINMTVGENDILYHLGDFSFGSIDNYRIRNKIKCKNIHYICGNHSNKNGREYDPVMSCGNRVSSLFSTYGFYQEIFHKKTRIVLFHYPIASWNDMGESIHLHGHTHRSPEDRYVNGGRSMDVGLDGNNLMPYSLDDIVEDLKKRPVKREGHHS